jgi:hypothetical protein
MIVLHVSRLLAAAAFVVLGIVWSGNHSLTVAIWWAVCAAIAVVLTVLADLSPEKRRELAYMIPGASKNWEDYV